MISLSDNELGSVSGGTNFTEPVICERCGRRASSSTDYIWDNTKGKDVLATVIKCQKCGTYKQASFKK